jgi:hypothetical protein
MASVTVPYAPNPAQAPFHRSRAFERLLVGGFGSGKSYTIVAEAIAWMLEQPGIRGCIARATVPALKASTEAIFIDLLPPELWEKCQTSKSGGHFDTITFPNGSEVQFKSLHDWKRLRSINYGFLAIDEADEIDNETYEGMLARIRQVDPTAAGRKQGATKITRRGVWMAMNPSGHSWHWERFVRDAAGTDREWFRTTSLDNPYLPPEYIETLLTYPPQWIKRYVLAAWDDFAGQIYEAWSDRSIVPRYPIDALARAPQYPAHSTFWMGLDPGMRDPTAGLWVCVERQPRFRLVGVAEYQEASLDVVEHTRAFRRIESKHRLKVTKRIADPNRINIRDNTTPTKLSDAYRRRGYNFSLGPSRFDDRIPALGTLIANGQFVVTDDCPMTYESIRDARWKDLMPAAAARGEAPPDEPEKGKNRHLCDAAEYLAGQHKAPVRAAPVYPDHMPDWQREVLDTIRKDKAKAAQPERREVEGIPL